MLWTRSPWLVPGRRVADVLPPVGEELTSGYNGELYSSLVSDPDIIDEESVGFHPWGCNYT